MPKHDTSWEQELLRLIAGEQLSAVTFVQDYVQLHFDGPGLTAITWPVVVVEGRRYERPDPGYRDALCSVISRRVTAASIIAGESICITFGTSAVIMVSLKNEDYRGAEAARFDVDSARWWVL